MKKIFVCAGLLLLISVTTVAQTNPGKAKNSNKTGAKAGNAITLNSVNSYPAKTTTSILRTPQTTYTIADPILTTLNKRAHGADISFNKSGIVGMPKRAYGFANGRVLLTTTGAVTSGTQTGSGAVGTGTSQATFGSVGASMNVNGKSPYAGINMWGNAMNMMIIRSDSSLPLRPLKRQ